MHQGSPSQNLELRSNCCSGHGAHPVPPNTPEHASLHPLPVLSGLCYVHRIPIRTLWHGVGGRTRIIPVPSSRDYPVHYAQCPVLPACHPSPTLIPTNFGHLLESSNQRLIILPCRSDEYTSDKFKDQFQRQS